MAHDFRYALDCTKIREELGRKPRAMKKDWSEHPARAKVPALRVEGRELSWSGLWIRGYRARGLEVEWKRSSSVPVRALGCAP